MNAVIKVYKNCFLVKFINIINNIFLMTFREEEKMIFKGSNYIIKYYNFFFFPNQFVLLLLYC